MGGGASFKRAKGKCFVELKCEEGQDALGTTHICIWVGEQPRRGPVLHKFSEDAVARLPKDIEMWDVKKSLDQMPLDPVWAATVSMCASCLFVGVELWRLHETHNAPAACA